jgi:cytochrome c peroxidase
MPNWMSVTCLPLKSRPTKFPANHSNSRANRSECHWITWARQASCALLAGIFIGISTSSHADDVLRKEAQALFNFIEAVPEASLSEPEVVLGRALFWDTRLSANGQISCASCHTAEDWGSDRRRFSLDARDQMTARHSQTVFNSMLQPSLRWTGDRKSGAHQAERSLTGSMGFEKPEAILPLLRQFDYEESFRRAFPEDPEPMTPGNYGKALQTYQATLITPAPLDRFLAGDDSALSKVQKEGLQAFISIGCADCHRGSLLGGRALRKFGLEKDYWTVTRSEKIDAGVYETSKVEADRYRFRVSMLRNVAHTAPYFHDGSVADLKEAVQVMAEVQLGSRIEDHEAAALVAFLEALSGEVPSHYAPPSTALDP